MPGGGDTMAEQNDEGQRPEGETSGGRAQDSASGRRKSDFAAAAVGVAFWVIVAGVGLYIWYGGRTAVVILNLSSADPVVASGVVTYEGQPVDGGLVHVVVEEPSEERHLSSQVVEIEKPGRFTASFPAAGLGSGQDAAMRVTARYVGRATDKTLRGSATVYVNRAPPWNLWWSAAAVVVPIVTLVWLFTGPLKPRKARLLFGITYVVTFSALVVPIVMTVVVARDPHFVRLMEGAPVGILKATARGLDEPQWLLNIGGAVRPALRSQAAPPAMTSGRPPGPAEEPPRPTPRPAEEPPAPTPAPDRQADSSDEAGIADDDTAALPRSDRGVAETPASSSSARDDVAATSAEVVGGLAIPLYVLILAMLGAAINMTRRVPEIQRDFDEQAAATWMGALTSPAAMLPFLPTSPSEGSEGNAAKRRRETWVIRKELIETYMYFLSAPFLAIAVYYLLQVAASTVNQPILVVIAFASGLMSNTVVGAIIAFADRVLHRAQQSPEGGENGQGGGGGGGGEGGEGGDPGHDAEGGDKTPPGEKQAPTGRAQPPPEGGDGTEGAQSGEGAEGGDPGHDAEGEGEAPGRDRPAPGG